MACRHACPNPTRSFCQGYAHLWLSCIFNILKGHFSLLFHFLFPFLSVTVESIPGIKFTSIVSTLGEHHNHLSGVELIHHVKLCIVFRQLSCPYKSCQGSKFQLIPYGGSSQSRNGTEHKYWLFRCSVGFKISPLPAVYKSPWKFSKLRKLSQTRVFIAISLLFFFFFFFWNSAMENWDHFIKRSYVSWNTNFLSVIQLYPAIQYCSIWHKQWKITGGKLIM